MKRIPQRRDDDCGIACAASILGETYAQARHRIFGDGEVSYTKTKQLIAALEGAGVRCGSRLIPFGAKKPTDLLGDALLKVNPREGGKYWHWVVWDFARQEIIDPKVPPYKRRKCVSYLAIDRTDILAAAGNATIAR